MEMRMWSKTSPSQWRDHVQRQAEIDWGSHKLLSNVTNSLRISAKLCCPVHHCCVHMTHECQFHALSVHIKTEARTRRFPWSNLKVSNSSKTCVTCKKWKLINSIWLSTQILLPVKKCRPPPQGRLPQMLAVVHWSRFFCCFFHHHNKSLDDTVGFWWPQLFAQCGWVAQSMWWQDLHCVDCRGNLFHSHLHLPRRWRSMFWHPEFGIGMNVAFPSSWDRTMCCIQRASKALQLSHVDDLPLEISSVTIVPVQHWVIWSGFVNDASLQDVACLLLAESCGMIPTSLFWSAKPICHNHTQ